MVRLTGKAGDKDAMVCFTSIFGGISIYGGAKGLSTNNLVKIALRFGLDLVAAIEQNRRRSSATLRIL